MSTVWGFGRPRWDVDVREYGKKPLRAAIVARPRHYPPHYVILVPTTTTCTGTLEIVVPTTTNLYRYTM